nr:DUF1294 domain-containing protein [Brevundimonas lenta]
MAALAVAGAVAFSLFAIDKQRAREDGRRIPERVLLLAALFGGAGAWLGQQLLRHKTRKQPFRTLLGAVLLLHILGVAVLLWTLSR